MRRIVMPVWVLLISPLFVAAGPAWTQVETCSSSPDEALGNHPVIPVDACVPGGIPFEIPSDFRDPATANSFSLSPPGARSLAMGGAFLGLADDATAAYTNPAGLTNLSVGGSEVAIELRGADFRSSFSDRGHYNTTLGGPTERTFAGQDSVDGLQFGEASGETTGLSFLSYGMVLPGGLTLALYRHELGNFQSSFEAQGPFNDDDCSTGTSQRGRYYDGFDCHLYRVQPSRSSIDLEIVNYGISAAYAFDIGSASSLSVGLGISHYESDFSRRAEVFDVCRFDTFDPDEPRDPYVDPGADPPTDLDDPEFEFPRFPCTQNESRSRLPGGFYGPADFGPDNSYVLTNEFGDDHGFGINLGFLLNIGRERRLSVGGVFRQGPDFDTAQRTEIGEDAYGPPEVRSEGPGSLTVPDVLGLGFAYRSADGLTKFTFDWNRVRYSQTLGDFTRNLGLDCWEDVEQSDCLPADVIDYAKTFVLDDIDQFHFGFERIVLVVESLFVGTARFGVWSEPAHKPRYIGIEGERQDDLLTLFGQQPDDDEIHVSVGFGLVIKEDYQLDFAANFSDINDTYSLSLVKFF